MNLLIHVADLSNADETKGRHVCYGKIYAGLHRFVLSNEPLWGRPIPSSMSKSPDLY